MCQAHSSSCSRRRAGAAAAAVFTHSAAKQLRVLLAPKQHALTLHSSQQATGDERHRQHNCDAGSQTAAHPQQLTVLRPGPSLRADDRLTPGICLSCMCLRLAACCAAAVCCEARGCWHLGLQGLQEDTGWWRLRAAVSGIGAACAGVEWGAGWIQGLELTSESTEALTRLLLSQSGLPCATCWLSRDRGSQGAQVCAAAAVGPCRDEYVTGLQQAEVGDTHRPDLEFHLGLTACCVFVVAACAFFQHLQHRFLRDRAQHHPPSA